MIITFITNSILSMVACVGLIKDFVSTIRNLSVNSVGPFKRLLLIGFVTYPPS